MYKFTAASQQESIVFGAARPGYRDSQVQDWIDFMQQHQIKRVCCLLTPSQLDRYSNLLETYRQRFGAAQVCECPIADFHIVKPDVFYQQILPFLSDTDQRQEKVVVHCSGGVGRSGHVLAAWLVAGRGFTPTSAIAAVKQMGRNPYEAVLAAPFTRRNPWQVAAELKRLLEHCTYQSRKTN
jgi:protein-tyrosine phosphatase